jgi:hypothetical protein
MLRSRLLTLAGTVLLAAACTGDKRAADTTSAVTTTATSNAQLADSAIGTPGANPAASTPLARSTPGSVPNGATGAAAAVPKSAAGVVTAPGTTPAGAPATDTARPAPTAQAPAQTPAAVSAAPQEPLAKPGLSATTRPPIPYSSGERLVYDVKFSAVDVGDAVMEVLGLENVRGRQALHIRFTVKGGTLFYKVNDRYESWIDTLRLISLRHWQQIDEGSYERERRYEIMPEIGTYKENDKPEQPTVAEPLDDGSFFYFLRTIPLEVGKTYTFERYFRPDRNPVTVTVVRRERIKVPAGTFDAIVLHPTIKAKGIFGEGGQAEIWLTDDSTKTMLQMKSKLKIGSLNLYLKSIRRGGS